MEANQFLQRIYYKARDESQINQLPFFFGWVDIENEKITGEHYKPKIDQFTGAYLIGYYKIEGKAADFLQTFRAHALTEITPEDFNTLLSQWTRGGEYAPTCWGLGLAWEIVKSS